MGARRFFHLGLSILAVVFLFACVTPGKKDFDTGMQLKESGNYTEAILRIEQAIKKEPNNKEYQLALANIKGSLIDKYVTQGADALASESPVTIGAISMAKDKLAEARKIDAGNADVQNLAVKIKNQQNSLLSDVKDLYSSAKQQMDNGEHVKAYFNLRQIQSRFPNYENSSQLLRQTADKGSMSEYKKAKALFDKEDFAGAKEHLRKALALKGDHRPSRKLMGMAMKRDSKEYFVQQAKEAVFAQKWSRAVGSYERALEYSPDDETLRQLIGHVRLKAGEFYVRNGRTQMDEGWLLKGFESFKLAKEYASGRDDFQISNLRRDLTSRAAYVAEQFKERGQFGSAWFWYEKIQSIDPDYPKIFFLTQEMEDNIQQRVQKSIAVFDFNSPSNSPDAGIIFANNLITYLFNHASGDIKILERENLKSILEEMKLGQIGVVSGNTAKQMGRVYGIDVAIMGSVLRYKVEASSYEDTKSVEYQRGTRTIENPAYRPWMMAHPNPSPELLKSAPPPTIEKPLIVEKDYKVSVHKKDCFIELSFRIVDVSTGENIQVDTMGRTKKVRDETSAGVKYAGIKFDPLEIASDTELLQNLTDELVAELGREVLKPLQNLEKTYYQNGEKLLRRREKIHAAENFVDAVFDEKMKRVQGSPLSMKAREHIHDIFLNYEVSIGG